MSDSAKWIRRFVKCDLDIETRDKLLAIADELEAAQKNAVFLQSIAAQQANDDGLWFIAEYITEQYLQSALRRLHAAIESKP